MKVISNRKLQEIIQWKPHVNQREILKSDKKEIVIAAGRGFGKSMLCAYLCLKELLKDNRRVLVVAPTYGLTERVLRHIEQWTAIGFPSIRDRISYSPTPHIKTEWGSSLECRSAEKPVGILGERYDLVVVDEASKIPRKTWEIYIYPTTQIKGGKILYISTPWGENWFHEIWIRTKGFQFRSIDNPYFKKKDWEEARKVLPEAVFQQEHEASFLPDAAAVFRGIDKIVKDDALRDVITGHRYVMGVDLGKHNDFTVLTVIDKWNNNVVYFDRFKKIEYPFQKKRIIATAKRYNNARIVVDSTGVGEPIKDDLERSGLFIDDYHFSGKSKKELVEKLSIFIENQYIHIPNIAVLIDELKVFGYEITEKRNITYSAPQGLHDDCVISLGLAVWRLIGKSNPTTAIHEELSRISRKKTNFQYK